MAQIQITSMEAASSLDGRELIEVSKLSETVTITATTLSADGDDQSFNDSANGFVTAGFAAGDRVNVTGFTGDTANNIFVAVVTVAAAGKLTIGGTDGGVIVDDAAGESVTIAKWETKRISVQDLLDLNSTNAAAVATQSGTAYDLLNADAGTFIRFTNAAAKAVTVQEDATEPLSDDVEFHIRNAGAGDLTLVEDGAVVINPPSGGTLVVPQGGTVTLKRVATDVFDLMGQVVPV